MKHLLTVVFVSVVAFIVYASVDWSNFDFSLSTTSGENAPSGKLSKAEDSYEDMEVSEEDNGLWIDTIMYAKGHAFGYSGDVSMWGGWFLDTIFVGDDLMLQYDSVGPSSLKTESCGKRSCS